MENLLKMYHPASASKIKHQGVARLRNACIKNVHALREVDQREKPKAAPKSKPEMQIKHNALDSLQYTVCTGVF